MIMDAQNIISGVSLSNLVEGNCVSPEELNTGRVLRSSIPVFLRGHVDMKQGKFSRFCELVRGKAWNCMKCLISFGVSIRI